MKMATSTWVLRLQIATSLLFVMHVSGYGVYEWMVHDNFDEIIDRMDAVNELNCEAKSQAELHLPEDAVSQMVQTNKLRTSDFQGNYYRNRTALLQLHTTVLTNAYKYSYLYQRLNQTWNADDLPSLFYYYLGMTADVTANLGLVNGSAVFFDKDLFYPNFLSQTPINKTVPLFGPRAWRIDDYNDPANWLREPTNNTFKVTDYGAGPFRNYTLDAYKINDWYRSWLPDIEGAEAGFVTLPDEVNLNLKYSPSVGKYFPEEGFKFFGPPSPFLSDAVDKLPVQFTRPYFDCSRSNKWIVSAVAPIYDRLPKYAYDPSVTGNVSAGSYDNIRRNMRVGVAVADVDFLNIDIDPCGSYVGDDGPNFFSGIDRCHKESTICKPLFGFGFQRGGYMCECRPGFRYPEYIQGPYLGVAIERATEEEYNAGFHCLPSGDLYVVPELIAEQDDNAGIGRLPGSVQNRKKREVSASAKQELMKEIAAGDRKRRDTSDAINGITLYANSKTRFIRKAVPKNMSSLREIREQYLAKRRVTTFQGIPDYIQEELAKNNADLGMGSQGRRIVAKFKAKADRKAKDESKKEKKLSRKKRSAFNAVNLERAQDVFRLKTQLTPDNCLSFTEEEWKLPGDTKYGVKTKLERFGRLGVRLADFLSSFLQNVDGQQDYGTLKGDKLLKEEQLFSEVLSVILAEPDVEGIGLFFDTDQFHTYSTLRAGSANLTEALRYLLELQYGAITDIQLNEELQKIADGYKFVIETTKELFGPYAYTVLGDGQKDNYFTVDRAGDATRYTDLEWFKDIKRRWSYNTEGLVKYTLNPWIRSDDAGKNIRKHEEYPLVWYSAGYESGLWSDPYFDCLGYVKDWILSYRVPFFGNTGYGSAVEFRGIVTVDVKLDLLDIEQCPSDFYTSNAFMGTARCDYETTYCQRIENQGFQLHQGYRCDCKQGYEYPWKGANEYFYTGDLIEDSRQRYLRNDTNRFNRLVCRMSTATHPKLAVITLFISLIFSYFMH